MLIFDQLRKDDAALRAVAVLVLSGLGVLLAGLWWVQVVSARTLPRRTSKRSRSAPCASPRCGAGFSIGNGVALAENRPTYNVSLYLEELRRSFDTAYAQKAVRAGAT